VRNLAKLARAFRFHRHEVIHYNSTHVLCNRPRPPHYSLLSYCRRFRARGVILNGFPASGFRGADTARAAAKSFRASAPRLRCWT